MKKKMTIAALALTLVLSLAACGGGKDNNGNLDNGLANNGVADGGTTGNDVNGNGMTGKNGDSLLDDVEDGADDLARSARNAARDMMR